MAGEAPAVPDDFTPTSSSWLNLAERSFAELTAGCGRASSFASVQELKDSIVAHLVHIPMKKIADSEGKKIIRTE